MYSKSTIVPVIINIKLTISSTNEAIFKPLHPGETKDISDLLIYIKELNTIAKTPNTKKHADTQSIIFTYTYKENSKFKF